MESMDCQAQEKEGCGKVDLHNGVRKAVFFKHNNYLSIKRDVWGEHSSRKGEMKKTILAEECFLAILSRTAPMGSRGLDGDVCEGQPQCYVTFCNKSWVFPCNLQLPL